MESLALTLAVQKGHADIAQMLLEARRKAPQTGLDDCSPGDIQKALGRAIEAGNNLLLQAGAKTDLRDKDGRTPLQHAIKNEYREIEALLRNCNTKIS